MYYEGVSSQDGKHRILMAESNDGRTWTKTGLALDVGEEGAWDCNGVSSPHCIRYAIDDDVIRTIGGCLAEPIDGRMTHPFSFPLLMRIHRLDDGTCRMYYTGTGLNGSTAIGVARLSALEGPAEWVREQTKITFSTAAD